MAMPSWAVSRISQPAAPEVGARLPAIPWSAVLRLVPGIAVLAGLYYASAELGYALNFTGPVAAIVWLPVGVGISFLCLFGVGFWPGLVIGDLLANEYSTIPLGSAIGQTCGNVLEVLVAVVLIQRLLPERTSLGTVNGMARLLVSLLGATLVSATIGLLSLRLGGVVKTGQIPKLWQTWWLGDLSGALLVVPLALSWSVPAWRDRLRHHLPEGVVVAACLVGLSEIAFHTSTPILYIVFPVLIWTALRFGLCGSTLAVAVAGGYAVWATTNYIGPFTYGSVTTNVLEVQLYITVASLSSLFLAVVVSERQGFEDRLRESRTRLAQTADIERRRIEHDLHDGAQQRLTALAVFLEIAAEQASREPSRAPALFGRAERDLLVAIDELRQLAHGIQPPMLTRWGVSAAIRRVATRSTLPVTLGEMTDGRFDAGAEAAVYFVVVEAMTNAQKHSHASSLRVSIAWRGGSLVAEVVDDGVGGVKEGGYGMHGMRDRVEALGGHLTVLSEPGAGTRIRAAIPAISISG
jgi:signal transduction histidine kinase